MSGRRPMLFLWACALVTAVPFVRIAHAGPDERLTYEIVLTNPGTRSQGWHGTLYDEKGAVIRLKPGETQYTVIGTLESVACSALWKPCGMIPQTPMSNDIVREHWSYKLYTTNIGSKCPSWRGDLVRDGAIIPPRRPEVKTPWGPFISLPESHGWAHKSWKVEIGPSKC